MTGEYLIREFPDVRERSVAWLEMGSDAPVVQNAFPDLNADERELLMLKGRGFSPEMIEDMMNYWKAIEQEEREYD